MRVLDIDTVWLQPGQHKAPADMRLGHIPVMCLMETISYIAGERWSDRPACVSPLLVGFGRTMNDLMTPHARQRLKALIPSMIGTGSDRDQALRMDSSRTWICMRHVLRRWIPELLERHNLFPMALAIRELPEVVDSATAAQARELLREMRVAAWAASHFVGTAVDHAMHATGEAAMEGMRQDIGYRNTGTRVAEVYGATHSDKEWDEALELFDELLQVSDSQ